MKKLTTENIQKIVVYVKTKSLSVPEQQELIDHIACDLESQMTDNLSFETVFKAFENNISVEEWLKNSKRKAILEVELKKVKRKLKNVYTEIFMIPFYCWMFYPNKPFTGRQELLLGGLFTLMIIGFSSIVIYFHSKKRELLQNFEMGK